MTELLPASYNTTKSVKIRIIIILSLALWLIDNLFLGGFYIAPGITVLVLATSYYFIKRYQRLDKPLPCFLRWVMQLMVEDPGKDPSSDPVAKE